MTKKVVRSPKKQDFLSGKFEILIPTNIFLDRKVSVLEALVEYLREEYKFSYAEISKLTNRDKRNIWTIYSRAKDKRIIRTPKTGENAYFPLKTVHNRSRSIFECIILHLRIQGASNKLLASLFNRSPKTISTVFNRAKKK